MHALHVVADGSPGGGTTAVLDLCRSLIAMGWRISIVTQSESYAFICGEKIGATAFGLDFFRSRFDLNLTRGLKKIIRDVRPDLIHAHGGRAMNPFWQPPMWGLAQPLIYTVHGYHFLHKYPSMRWLGWAAEYVMARRASRVIFVGEADKKIAFKSSIIDASIPTSIIYNGVDPEDFSEPHLAEKRFDLVFAARMHRQKNPEFMIDVMAQLKDTDMSLLMIGGGELEDQVKQKAISAGVADKITFCGVLSRIETLRMIKTAREFVFPSLWEGLPIGPIEAMAAGLPVVASKIPGTDEVVQNGITGILVEGFNAKKYASELEKLTSDPVRLTKMANAGRRAALEKFNSRVNALAHLSLYQNEIERAVSDG